MASPIVNVQSIQNVDILTPQATAQYVVGEVYQIQDSVYGLRQAMYVKAHAALVAGASYVIVPNSALPGEFITKAPVTSVDAVNLVGTALSAVTSGYYCFLTVEGVVSAGLAATTYTIGDFVKLISAATSFTPITTSGSTTMTVAAAAMCLTVGTAGGVGNVLILNRMVTTPAS